MEPIDEDHQLDILIYANLKSWALAIHHITLNIP